MHQIVLTALVFAGLVFASPVAPKERKKPVQRVARTWKTIADHVIANGTERTLKAPLTRNLGFDSDVVITKALRFKADTTPDKKQHAFYVVSFLDKDGNPVAKEFILGHGFSVEKNGVKHVEDFFLRADLSGRIIASIKSTGPAGQVEEKKLASDSPEAIAGLKAEQTLYLKTMDIQKLSK